jgi:uncharacterized protein (DUF2249 family)
MYKRRPRGADNMTNEMIVRPKDPDKLAKQLFNTEHGLYASEHRTAGQDIVRKRIARGDIEEGGLLYTKRGINK